MTSEMWVGLLTLCVTTAIGWAVNVEQRLSRHATILDKLDQLIQLLLEDRIAQSEKGSDPQESGNRGSSHQRRDSN